MSILIPNMKIPVDCKECPFAGRGKVAGIIELIVCELTNGYRATLINGRMESCPLIELQPHGRLIDVDVICAECKRVAEEYDGIYPDCTYCPVNLAPAVIEAEEVSE